MDRDEDNAFLTEELMTPVGRLYDVADKAHIIVFDVTAEDAEGYAGAVGIGFDEQDTRFGLVGLAEDLDDDLRADVLSFGIAAVVGDAARIMAATDGYLAIERTRRPAAQAGVGHLAWHIARSCGRATPSATFDLVDIET
ncbi:hypothetical protein [Actinokineospora sp. NBRC 105648]|uniref:hypothetical protein n=1 Tax=Actinokineospora sp. NBRC 105648 TaxID=3032206 RepID=UPI002556B0C2|nr:hypothetical protein [Actinokineospora sp. NBRC 105648]